jgi:hypothetical protein
MYMLNFSEKVSANSPFLGFHPSINPFPPWGKILNIPGLIISISPLLLPEHGAGGVKPLN